MDADELYQSNIWEKLNRAGSFLITHSVVGTVVFIASFFTIWSIQIIALYRTIPYFPSNYHLSPSQVFLVSIPIVAVGSIVTGVISYVAMDMVWAEKPPRNMMAILTAGFLVFASTSVVTILFLIYFYISSQQMMSVVLFYWLPFSLPAILISGFYTHEISARIFSKYRHILDSEN